MKNLKKALKLNKKGFTLVELIVVIAILGVLAAILVPAFTGYVTKAQDASKISAAKSYCTAYQAAWTEATAKNDITNLTTKYLTPLFSVADQTTVTGVVTGAPGAVVVDVAIGKCTVTQ